MKQQSGNNLNELYRNAAAEYPLKVSNSNWNVVAIKLNTTTTTTTKKATSNQEKYILFSLLILLVVGATILSFYTLKSADASNKVLSEGTTIVHNKTTETVKQKNLIKIEHSSILLSSQSELQNNYIKSLDDNFLHPKLITGYADNDALNASNTYSRYKTSDNIVYTNKVFQTSDLKEIKAVQTDKLFPSVKINNATGQNNHSAQTIHLKLQPESKFFYGSIYYSPNFSSVRSQHIDKPGYRIGVALGYKINSRLSAEIGLMRLHTNFYSKGDYFESHLKLKPNVTINAVNGNSKITEIPIGIKYNIFKNNEHFFAGINTTVALFTHNEQYSYKVTKNGSESNVSRKFNALAGTRYISNLGVSAGYQTNIYKAFKLNIEPYYQVATKGFGIGNLPVNNFGINIGIIKKLK